MNQNLLQQS